MTGGKPFALIVNRRHHLVAAAAGSLLLDVLRHDLRLNGPKYGCGLAQCGACTVLVAGLPAHACVMTLAALRGRPVLTLEGLAGEDGALHPVQQAFLDEQGAQCGYCLNGMVMVTVALLASQPAPDDLTIRAALRHNLCRCGTHAQILASVRRAAQLMQRRNADAAG